MENNSSHMRIADDFSHNTTLDQNKNQESIAEVAVDDPTKMKKL